MAYDPYGQAYNPMPDQQGMTGQNAQGVPNQNMAARWRKLLMEAARQGSGQKQQSQDPAAQQGGNLASNTKAIVQLLMSGIKAKGGG